MPHSKYQLGGTGPLAAVFSAAHGLTGALPGNGTLAPTGAAISVITLGDGRSAWRFPAAGTSRLATSPSSVTGFYGGAAFVRFVWNGYNAAQVDGRVAQIGDLLYVNVTNSRVVVTSINGQTINLQNTTNLTVGQEYCVVVNLDYSTLTAAAYLNGTQFGATTALSSWTPNSSISTTLTLGDPNATARIGVDIIECGWCIAGATTQPLTTAQISSISGGSYFLDITRPNHPATAPTTFTSSILGGRLTDVHTVSLRRTSHPISDAGTIVATTTRTGPGPVTIADPTADSGGRKFYRLEVSTGGVALQSTHHAGDTAVVPAPGGYVLGCAPVITAPQNTAFSAVPFCPIFGVIGNSRTPTRPNLNVPYRIMRGGTNEDITVLGAPGSEWSHWLPSSANFGAATLNGNAISNVNLMSTYLAAAASAGVTVTIVMLDVNAHGYPATDTTYQANVLGVITALRNAGHRVVIQRDIGSEIGNVGMGRYVDHEAYIATLADGINVIYSDDQAQRWYASKIDLLSTDGTHLTGVGPLNLAGTAVDGLTAGQAVSNWLMLAGQTAVTPGILLSISNSVGSMQPGESLQRTLTIRPRNSYRGNVALAVTGLPTGVTASFSPTSPINITSDSAVSVVMTLTAAQDAPLLSNPATITVTATAGTSVPTTSLALTVVDTTPPQIQSVTVNGPAVTVVFDSLCTGTAGLSFLIEGQFVGFGSAVNQDGFSLTGTLSTAAARGSVVTWRYSPSTGNIVDVGGNEIPASSGTATNTTGGGSTATTPGRWVNGPYLLTPVDGGQDGMVSLFVGDSHALGFILRDGAGKPIDTTASIVTFLVTDSDHAVVSGPIDAVTQWASGGVHAYPLQSADTATVQKLSLTAKIDGGAGNVVIVGPATLNVRAR